MAAPPSYGDVAALSGAVERKKLKLWESSAERRKMDDMADLYAIIKTMEHLEKAFARDAVGPEEYATACNRLISQFKASESALASDGTISDTASFMEMYRMDCPRAADRLLRAGVAATVLHGASEASVDPSSKVLVAETVQHFITAMDLLKLDMRAVDELHPVLSDLLSSLRKMALPAEYIGAEKIESWLRTLNSMRAVDELDEDQCRQMSFDLDGALSDFHRCLKDS
eukprot:PLAT2933.1.p2 GENE.PLAT2933.1~~PLAT2933.1.p2  ORF type:complete len:238 (+),score=104.31 PLAT2933.1:31-714(+)